MTSHVKWIVRMGSKRSVLPSEYRVVQHHRGKAVLRVLLAAVATVLLVAAGWWLGRQEAGLVRADNARLAQELQAAGELLAQHQRQLGELAMAGTVDAGAQAYARRDIASLSATVAELERELRFYRAVMPRSGGQRLHIASLELHPLPQGGYRYDVLLTRHFRAEDVISGELQVDIDGHLGDREVKLSLQELADPDSYPLAFEFRYFQALSGTLRLPAGFEPAGVEVRASSRDLKRGDARRRFEWQVADESTAAALAAVGSGNRERQRGDG